MHGADNQGFLLPILSVNLCAVLEITSPFGITPLDVSQDSPFPRRASDLIH